MFNTWGPYFLDCSPLGTSLAPMAMAECTHKADSLWLTRESLVLTSTDERMSSLLCIGRLSAHHSLCYGSPSHACPSSEPLMFSPYRRSLYYVRRSPCPPCRCYPHSVAASILHFSHLLVRVTTYTPQKAGRVDDLLVDAFWCMHEEFIQEGARQMEWKQSHSTCKLAWRVWQGAKVQHGPSQSLQLTGR